MQECDEELRSVKRLGEYELVDTPIDRKNIDTRWVFNENEDESGYVTSSKIAGLLNGTCKLKGSDMTLRTPLCHVCQCYN